MMTCLMVYKFGIFDGYQPFWHSTHLFLGGRILVPRTTHIITATRSHSQIFENIIMGRVCFLPNDL